MVKEEKITVKVPITFHTVGTHTERGITISLHHPDSRVLSGDFFSSAHRVSTELKSGNKLFMTKTTDQSVMKWVCCVISAGPTHAGLFLPDINIWRSHTLKCNNTLR
ncbi:hypothetical protein GOODEAATRI_030076 [Goodea atripinnis]|uniref:Uncharacterized protein n=1 Tax=Goodea atripinnis TaxID=208336 RepID=A0ABV0PT27_9TELE